MTYEYECPTDGPFNYEAKFGTAPQQAPCPKCGTMSKRLISRSGFLLKGGGWSSDGYAGEKPIRTIADAKASEASNER